MKIILFFSYLRTLISFYVFRDFRNWNYQQIEFFKKSFKPTCKRDENLAKKIMEFNKKQLKKLEK